MYIVPVNVSINVSYTYKSDKELYIQSRYTVTRFGVIVQLVNVLQRNDSSPKIVCGLTVATPSCLGSKKLC